MSTRAGFGDTDSIPVVSDAQIDADTDAVPEAAAATTEADPGPAADPRSSVAPAPLSTGRLALVIVAMALGSFAIGVTEFASMGLLPMIAADFGVTVPTAGILISAYALGVVVGAPLIVVAAARMGRKQLLVLLASLLAGGNLLSALAPDFATMVGARFLAGLPHGAYFGVAALIAARLSPPNRRGRSVSQVMLGLTIATMVGVPASTALGQAVGWRSAYLVVVVIATVTVVATWRLVPVLPVSGPPASARGELRALRYPQVWFALGIGAVGFGGMFAVYSYIGEIVPGVLDMPVTAVPLALLVFGVGMTVGTVIAGYLVDRSVMGTVCIGLIGMAVSLAAFALIGPTGATGLVMLFVIAVASQQLGPSLQTFLLDASPEGKSLAAALHHSAMNIGNAVGAAVGGAVLAAGLGLLAPAWAGAVLAVAGLGVASASRIVARRETVEPPNRADARPGR